jgi:hypothetical protein
LWRVDFELGTNDSEKIVSIAGPMASNRGSDKIASKIITNGFLIEGLFKADHVSHPVNIFFLSISDFANQICVIASSFNLYERGKSLILTILNRIKEICICSYFHTLEILVIQIDCEHTTISSLEFEMSSMHSIHRYRNSNTIMTYFGVANDNRQRKINLSILIALLLAKIYNELMHNNGFIHIFSNHDGGVKN